CGATSPLSACFRPGNTFAPAPAMPTASSPLPSSAASVLIVDDEPGVRNLMARWVASMGLNAKTAASADEALAALQAQQCDVAVIDVMMPGRDGLWLVKQLKRDHPDTAVVL